MVKRKRYLAVTLLMLVMAAAVGAVAYGVWSRRAVPVDGTQWSQPAQMPETTEPETAATDPDGGNRGAHGVGAQGSFLRGPKLSQRRGGN